MYTLEYKDEKHTDAESANTKIERNVDDEVGKIIDMVVMGDAQAPSEPGDGIHKDGIPGREGTQPTFFSSVRVYGIADKYDIPPLKELARQRFCNRAETHWDCGDFPAMVREVFDSTPGSDRGLRDVVFGLVAKHADVLLKRDDFQRVTEGTGELGLGVLLQLVRMHSEEKSALQTQIERLATEATLLKGQLMACQQNLENKSKKLATTTSKINELLACRHCGNDFNTEVESSLLGVVTIRCRSCRTRH